MNFHQAVFELGPKMSNWDSKSYNFRKNIDCTSYKSKVLNKILILVQMHFVELALYHTNFLITLIIKITVLILSWF